MSERLSYERLKDLREYADKIATWEAEGNMSSGCSVSPRDLLSLLDEVEQFRRMAAGKAYCGCGDSIEPETGGQCGNCECAYRVAREHQLESQRKAPSAVAALKSLRTHLFAETHRSAVSIVDEHIEKATRHAAGDAEGRP